MSLHSNEVRQFGLDVLSTDRLSNSSIAVIASDNVDVARTTLSGRYKEHQLRPVTGMAQVDFLHATTAVPEGSFNVLSYGVGMEIDPGDFGNFYMLEMPLNGGAQVSMGGNTYQSAPNTALFISPGQRLRSYWQPNTLQVMLKLDREQVLKRWRFHFDGEDELPEFQTAIDLRTQAGWRVQHLMLLLFEEFLQTAGSRSWELSQTGLSAAVIDAIIGEFETTNHHRESHAVLPRHIKQCVAYVLAHLGEQLSVAVLAQVSGASERAVFEGFRRFLGQTPMQYVLEKRLVRVHRQLALGETSVSEAARLCGFRHFGRFAKHYYQRFGQHPSETRRAATLQ